MRLFPSASRCWAGLLISAQRGMPAVRREWGERITGRLQPFLTERPGVLGAWRVVLAPVVATLPGHREAFLFSR